MNGAEAVNILLVEDDLVDARWVERALDSYGSVERFPMTLEHVDRLEKALGRLRDNNIQMILLDLGLPDADSHVDSVERIHGLVPDIPIVVLSGSSYELAGPDVLDKGALYYYPKEAAEAASLGHVIQITLEKHRQQANLRRVIEQNLDGMLIVDGDDRILFANPAARVLLDLPPNGSRQTFDCKSVRGERVEEALPSGASVEIQTVDLEWNGRPASLVTLHDVTEHRKLERQLRQSQKMEAIGMLAGGVAHDFNNLLTVIRGYAEMLLESLPETDTMHGDLLEIARAAERGTKVTGQLLAFSRQEVTEPRCVNLNEVVEGVQNLLKKLIGAEIELRFLPARDLADIHVDPGQLEQVIVNLAVNARDAMPGGGILTVETTMADVDAEMARGYLSAMEPGRYVMLTVSDDGVGMDKEILQHIFEPFFTTKAVGEGTGLGLSTVYGIVEQMGGSIWAYSEPGMGSTFKLYFPPGSGEDRRGESAVDSLTGRGGSETVLLVEDETPLREFCARILRTRGYQVHEAVDGTEALEVLMGMDRAPDLLVTDVVMPGIGGPELADRVLKRYPGMPVLYMSGYTRDAVIKRDTLEGDFVFLQKPFAPADLYRKIREILDRKKSG